MHQVTPLPGSYSSGLTALQLLLVLRCFRVDRIYRAVINYITEAMGESFVTPPVISYEQIFEKSTSSSPIVFILSPGADPAGELHKLAGRIGLVPLVVLFYL